MLQGRLGHKTVCHLEEAPSVELRSDGNRIPPETSLGIVPRGEGRETERGRGGETGGPGGKNT